jgi:hypothetical protein
MKDDEITSPPYYIYIDCDFFLLSLYKFLGFSRPSHVGDVTRYLSQRNASMSMIMTAKGLVSVPVHSSSSICVEELNEVL